MSDAMLSELYARVFREKSTVERLALCIDEERDEFNDRQRQVSIEKNKLLSELIDIRTKQIRQGTDNA